MHKLEQKGATVDYNDPYVPEIKVTREHHEYAGRKSVEITDDYDCVLVATHHDEYKAFDFSGFKAPLACHAVVLKSVGGSILGAV